LTLSTEAVSILHSTAFVVFGIQVSEAAGVYFNVGDVESKTGEYL